MKKEMVWPEKLFVLFFIIVFTVLCVGYFQKAKKAESYKHQLISVYGVIDNVISDGYVIENINIEKTYRKEAVEYFIELVSYVKKADGREDGASYTIFADRDVKAIHTMKDKPYQRLSWKEFPKFVEVFKK